MGRSDSEGRGAEDRMDDGARDLDRDDALFVNLVLMFQNAAMQQMGKFVNPITQKVERDLEHARFSIDVLAMLKAKTKGNLSQDIERLLDTTLTNLRLNFVDEMAADETARREGQAKQEEQAPGEEHARREGHLRSDEQAEPKQQPADGQQTMPAEGAGATGQSDGPESQGPRPETEAGETSGGQAMGKPSAREAHTAEEQSGKKGRRGGRVKARKGKPGTEPGQTSTRDGAGEPGQ